MIGIKKLWEAMPQRLQRKVSLHDLKQTVDAYNSTGSEFFSRLVDAIKIKLDENEYKQELAAWVDENPEAAVKIALDQATQALGVFVTAGVDPEEMLTHWMDAVHRHNASMEAREKQS